jgi:hypothetical protein
MSAFSPYLLHFTNKATAGSRCEQSQNQNHYEGLDIGF